MEYSSIRHVLRQMAWQRAKGELRSILSTFTDEELKAYYKTKDSIENFITEMMKCGFAVSSSEE